MKRLRTHLLLIGVAAMAHALQAATVLEIQQNKTRYNLQTKKGVPISQTVDLANGSDGRQPTLASQTAAGLTILPATTNQFRTFIAFGALAAPDQALASNLDPTKSLIANAKSIGLPTAEVGTLRITLTSVRVGAPYISRQLDFFFGSVITPPETDENGILIPVAGRDTYWLPEPFHTNKHAGEPYYWSIHAHKVYAIQPGPIQVVWRKAAPVVSPGSSPAGYSTDASVTQYDRPGGIGDTYYRLFRTSYVVSGSPVKEPRQIFWTEKSYRATGITVPIPKGLVVVNPVFNSEVKAEAKEEVQPVGETPVPLPPGSLTPGAELRTLWVENDAIHAYNQKGRIFIELLGDERGVGDEHEQLGVEIVDIKDRPVASDLTVELGERVTPYQDRDDPELLPASVTPSLGATFLYQDPGVIGSERSEFYAVRETQNLNDSRLFWLERGVMGLKWPLIMTRYRQVWPNQVARYSHYIRPVVTTEEEAKATAVPLPPENAPLIDFQDLPDQPRAKITPDFKFYTFLNQGMPAHRTLLRFQSGAKVRFERVLSWLDTSLVNNGLANSPATNLLEWTAGTGTVKLPDKVTSPRVVTGTAWVGTRLDAPIPPENSGGQRAVSGYDAVGYINPAKNNSYSVTAYVDPFVAGFEAAAAGSIIPVNAIPGSKPMEVLWFRRNSVDEANGFKTVRWPTALGRYTLVYPPVDDDSEIVLAGNRGSGTLPSLEAKGRVYYQNDRRLPGYNPNEEHALMQGGQAFALRDDLNQVGADPELFSSEPWVLLEYIDGTGRPAMHAYHVVRERLDRGIAFDFPIAAGTPLQPPMPLPLLDPPMVTLKDGTRINLNAETSLWKVAASSTSDGVTTLNVDSAPIFAPDRTMVLQNPGNPGAVTWFYATEVSRGTKQVKGIASARLPYTLRFLQTVQAAVDFDILDNSGTGLEEGRKVWVAAPGLRTNWTGTVVTSTPTTVLVNFGAVRPDGITNASALIEPDGIATAGRFNNWNLASEAAPAALASQADLLKEYSRFTYQDRKGSVWVYRGPHDPAMSPALFMQYYYKTLPGFHFPNKAIGEQPPVGTITPYLTARKPDGTGPEGDPVLGYTGTGGAGDGNPLGIAYYAVWPDDAPTMLMGETLTVPKRGLPAIRGQSSLGILYQQSVAEGGADKVTARLHDPTREKVYRLGDGNLKRLPASILTRSQRGKTYFPNLPPHLVDRFYFDPTVGTKGALVFKGQFVSAPVGESYLLLNVLTDKDLATLKALAKEESDASIAATWNAAIETGLQTAMEIFHRDPARPGSFVADANPRTVEASKLAEVLDKDTAVDSYALSAAGPGAGFVSLVAGDSPAATPEAEPVSILIVRVVPRLYRGELSIVESSNPLAEKLTLQQVNDLAGRPQDYEFQWRIAAPVDTGFPPVYRNFITNLVPSGAVWNHLPFPLPDDRAGTVAGTAIGRREVLSLASQALKAVQGVPVGSSVWRDGVVTLSGVKNQWVPGNAVDLRTKKQETIQGTVAANSTFDNLVVRVDPNQAAELTGVDITRVDERTTGGVQSIVYRSFTLPKDKRLTDLWLSLLAGPGLGVRTFVDGQPITRYGLGAGDNIPGAPPDDVAVPSGWVSFRLDADAIPSTAGSHVIAFELVSSSLPEVAQPFDIQLDAHYSDDLATSGNDWLLLDSTRIQERIRVIFGESADVKSLADNYVISRYRAKNADNAAYVAGGGWSRWTEPQLVEGWIKRVLKGINPFNQRVTDLYNNRVNTDANILTSAGKRWEGDVALNLDEINNYGLIEIYETVLRRGRLLSIDADIEYGPANDALLLAAGYLNDLYMLVGNEAWADAANPTIAVGRTLPDVATALFAFKGQVASLMEEELALLRGRDDFAQPGVDTAPCYNKLYWNYTRGIDSGEAIYALNYNIQPNPSAPLTGAITAADAAHMFPQGHGDAYGHYLTATKGYYSLLMSPRFQWMPRSEAVTVLGKAVQVDYQDERKFAAAAAAIARAGRQVFDLTWRADYEPGRDAGWSHLSATRTNNTGRAVTTVRHWGADHWASRVGQGAYVNWIVGNAILPARDPDPTHEGIQRIDRTTVPELRELPSLAHDLQVSVDGAEGGLSPLGLPEDGLAFDISPARLNAATPASHFEQVYERATAALNNAAASFNDARDVTKGMRSEQDALTEFQTQVDRQETAYLNQLIELYGTPYSDDIGPGRTYKSGYAGPDLFHFAYVENTDVAGTGLPATAASQQFKLDIQQVPKGWWDDFLRPRFTDRDGNPAALAADDPNYQEGTHYIAYELGPRGFADKPSKWVGRRASPGSLQQTISDLLTAHDNVRQALVEVVDQKRSLDKQMEFFQQRLETRTNVLALRETVSEAQTVYDLTKSGGDLLNETIMQARDYTEASASVVETAIPGVFIAGTAAGTDAAGNAGKAAVKSLKEIAVKALTAGTIVINAAIRAQGLAVDDLKDLTETFAVPGLEFDRDMKEAVIKLGDTLYAERAKLMTLNQRLRALEAAQRKCASETARGERILQERETFRLRSAAVVQGYRTRDAALRIFRNEKLERYKSLFDLASRYSLLAANAYDYETGLLHTDEGRGFVRRIVSSRALGVFRDGAPQFAGSNNGDPGLSSALAEMKADWEVLKGRLGFNNPDSYGTTVSLRTEDRRLLSGTDGDSKWRDVLERGRMDNLLDDDDVRRYCLQIDPGGGLAVPGIVLTFSTTIEDAKNLFGKDLAGGDHAYSLSSFATKIFAVGVAFEGYKGMDNPTSSFSDTSGTGAVSPSDPSAPFLGTDALAANPYIYLIPVGLDMMRSPPLGDTDAVRSWDVHDVSIPLPFNIGGSDFSTKPLWQTAESLTEPLFAERKHQAFRPVSGARYFLNNGVPFQRTQFMNARLIGRSVWNTQWKIVIPGRTLLRDPNEGLDRFIRTVKDVKLHFQTYSYSGN